MVRLAQSGDHFPFDESSAMRTFGAETVLVVFRAIVFAIFTEETALSQRIVADATFEARDVEVLVLDAEHLAGAFLLATLTLRFACQTNTKGG